MNVRDVLYYMLLVWLFASIGIIEYGRRKKDADWLLTFKFWDALGYTIVIFLLAAADFGAGHYKTGAWDTLWGCISFALWWHNRDNRKKRKKIAREASKVVEAVSGAGLKVVPVTE